MQTKQCYQFFVSMDGLPGFDFAWMRRLSHFLFHVASFVAVQNASSRRSSSPLRTIKGDGGKLTIPLHQRTVVAFLLTDRSMLLVSNVPALLSGTKVSAAMQSPSLRCDPAYKEWSCLCRCGATCPGWRTIGWFRR